MIITKMLLKMFGEKQKGTILQAFFHKKDYYGPKK